MRVKALYVALAEKMRHGEVLFVDTLDIAETKQKRTHCSPSTFIDQRI